jgi:hypothetical protein
VSSGIIYKDLGCLAPSDVRVSLGAMETIFLTHSVQLETGKGKSEHHVLIGTHLAKYFLMCSLISSGDNLLK